MKTGIVKDWRYRNHDMGAFHPESPQRIEAVYKMVEEEINFPFETVEPRAAEEEEILWVHSPSHLETLKNTAGKSRTVLDPDTSTSPLSYETGKLASGGVLSALDAIMEGKIQNGFALIRPPGHHAEKSRVMGFCLFNNIAIGTEYILRKHGIKRVLIVDWDLHHGNGTQSAFFRRNDVLFFSTHQFPHYPGTGHWSETGEGKGKGFTVNVPLSSGKKDADYLFIYESLLQPIVMQFKPGFILVSAGFDIYEGDPLGGMNITADGFAALSSKLMELAASVSQNKILFVLEGGYNLQGLREGVREVLHQLAGQKRKPEILPRPSSETEKELGPVFEIQKNFWRL